jgi:lipopolysaccharide export system permease protein
LRTLDRYIFREVAVVWVAVTGVLLVILLSNQLTRVLSQAAADQLPQGLVLALLGFSSIQNLTVIVPIGLFLAIMIGLGRLYHENEMAAIQAGGVGPAGIYRPVSVLTLGVAALLAWLSFFAVPTAAGQAQEIRSEALRQTRFGSIEPGRFRSFSGGQIVFYAESNDAQGVLYNVFVQRRVEDRVEIVTAARAIQQGSGDVDQTFVLYDGERYEGVPGNAQFRMLKFAEHGIPIRMGEVARKAPKHEMKSTSALWGSSEPEDLAELQWRFSTPIMAVMLMLIAVPLAKLRPRQSRYGKMGIAILSYFIYSNVLLAARVWVEKEIVPPYIGLWWVHALAGLAALYLLNREGLLFERRAPRMKSSEATS